MDVNFSIIMPNYNSAHLKRAISSVIDQTYDKWELIIIDDFSSNYPEKIIDEFKHNQISFYKCNNSNNIARSRNFGIKKSNNDWIAFLDSDDVWDKEKLFEVQKSIIKDNPDFIYHGMYYLPKKFGFIKKAIKYHSKNIKKPIFESLIKYGNTIANSSVVVRKKLLFDIDLLSEDVKKISWEDYDCWIRCSKKTDNFLYIPKILGYYWIGGGNITTFKRTYVNYKNFHKFYQKEIKFLINETKLDWYKAFLFLWYYKKRRIYRAHILNKKIKKDNIKLIIRSIHIKFLFTIKRITKLFKNKV
jgi:glycosyltransferase involved in cell wall biosynthesis